MDQNNESSSRSQIGDMPLTLKEYVMLVSDALPADFMKNLIADANASGEWRESTVGSKRDVRKQIRNCSQIGLTTGGKPWMQPYRRTFIQTIEKCLAMYKRRYPHVSVQSGRDLQLLRYEPGGFYSEHIDHDPAMPRTISLTFLLNDEFEGGEMSFFNERLVVSMKAGEIVMFPSNFLFPHGIQPVTSGVRFALVSWLY